MFRKHTDVLKAWNGQNTRGDVLQPEFDSERGKEARQAYREYYDSLPLPDDWAVLTLNRTGYCMCICDWCMKHNAFSNPPGGLNEHYPENVSNPEHKTMHRLYAENIGEPATSTPDAVMRAPPVSEPGSTVSQVDKNGYPLPDGWRQQTTTQGVLSYWHVTADKRQWGYPGGIVPSQVDADGTTLPPGWVILTHLNGTSYYHNTELGSFNEYYPQKDRDPEHVESHMVSADIDLIPETAISAPNAVLRAPPVTEPGSTVSQVDKNGHPLPDGWRQQTTTQGVLSYWHVMTDKRQWEYPGIVPSQVDADGNTLPAGWTMLTPSGGTPYYLNTVSGKTQWEHPGPGPSMNIPETWNDETRRAMSEH